QRAVAQLSDALRITLGTPEQNERVLSALQRKQEAAA
ncbi:MAG: histidinol-phosphate transaminase, partial [Xanthomonas perforans]|nr:histidinol-phosphate transaminase [Xanthomonas perforans]